MNITRPLLLVVLLTIGCNGPPAAPTTPPAEPAPAAVSVEMEPRTARVGETIDIDYRLSRALDRDLEFWTEVTPPAGETYTNTNTFAAGETALHFNTGYLGEQHIGDWAMRIMGDRLPEGVVLGNPSAVTWSVLP